jgi:hypothetical protein
MPKTRSNGEKSTYLVILLLFVGLTAFSNSMKELAQIHESTLDTGRLIARWSDSTAPASIPPQLVKVENVETCESKQSMAAVELPWLETERNAVAPARARTQQLKIQRTPRPVTSITFNADQLAKLGNLPALNFNPEQFEFHFVADNDNSDESIPAAVSAVLRAKTCKRSVIKRSLRDREIFLKSLNRSISLRIAG